MKKMKTCYEGHDGEYKKRLAAGAAGWDTSAEAYTIHQNKLKDILSAGHAPKSGKLLELGCGAGNIGLWFASLGYSVLGVDIAPTAVNLAQTRARESEADASFRVGNVVDLESFEDDTFDFVYDSHLLHCIIGDDRARLLENVARVMKPGAYFLVDTMCFSELWLESDDFDMDSYCTVVSSGIYTRYIGTEEALLEELRSTGFNILSHRLEADSTGHCVLYVEMTA